MPGNGNGGGNNQWGGGTWVSTGEGGQQARRPGGGSELTAGEGGTTGDWGQFGPDKPEPDPGPAPRVPVIREARNVQRANIDRTSLYDPTQATQALGTNYLQERNASNPQPLGSTGAGAVGYEFAPSNERLY